jgi:hypothetical protein
MNDLLTYFENNQRNRINKWMHYFEIYDRYFSPFRGTDVHVLEIGVYHGGSLQMWKEYFGSKARIMGVDIDPYCANFAEDQISIIIGNQGDRDFLRRLAQQVPRIDILIDDGGHTMQQQIATFDILFPHVSPNGIYLCEDLHTSYWRPYGGGYLRKGTFVEYSKYLIDELHAWHSTDKRQLPVSTFTKSAFAMHYYDSVLVIEKRHIEPPVSRMTGKATLPVEPLPPRLTLFDRVMGRLGRLFNRNDS